VNSDTEIVSQLILEALFMNNVDDDNEDKAELVVKPTKTKQKNRGKENQEAQNGKGKGTGKLTEMKDREVLKHKTVSNHMFGTNLNYSYSLL
jgi:hypothetical protein